MAGLSLDVPSRGRRISPSPEDRLLLGDLAAITPHGEDDAAAVAAVAEVARGGAVGDVDCLSVTDHLQPHPDWDGGRMPDIGGEPRRVGGIGPGIGHISQGGIGRSPDERFGLARSRGHRVL
jgi:hypothetical protein